MFEGCFIDLSEGVRKELDSAREGLEAVILGLSSALSAIEISAAARQDCFESLMTQVVSEHIPGERY